jgi:hypothetical protein
MINKKIKQYIASFYEKELEENYQIGPEIFADDKIFNEKMKKLFIEFPAYLRKCEFDNSQGLLSGYLYELFKEKILHINSKFRKWRKETNNEDNAKINVSYLHIILIYLNRRIFGNIIYLRILLY